MQTLIGWLLVIVALAWSFLVGLLAGTGAVGIARRSKDVPNLIAAVLFIFGGALVLTARMIPARFLLFGSFGLAAGVVLELALRSGAIELPFLADTDETVEPASSQPEPPTIHITPADWGRDE